jgi:ribonuclease HI
MADYYVYTDGACSNNGKQNARAGIGVYFGENDNRNISKKVIGKQSNNTAELTAIIEAVKLIEVDLLQNKIIEIKTDSTYAIKCATTYGSKCAALFWVKDIPNKELVRELYELVNGREKNIILSYIKAHSNLLDRHSIGNKNADLLATNSLI